MERWMCNSVITDVVRQNSSWDIFCLIVLFSDEGRPKWNSWLDGGEWTLDLTSCVSGCVFVSKCVTKYNLMKDVTKSVGCLRLRRGMCLYLVELGHYSKFANLLQWLYAKRRTRNETHWAIDWRGTAPRVRAPLAVHTKFDLCGHAVLVWRTCAVALLSWHLSRPNETYYMFSQLTCHKLPFAMECRAQRFQSEEVINRIDRASPLSHANLHLSCGNSITSVVQHEPKLSNLSRFVSSNEISESHIHDKKWAKVVSMTKKEPLRMIFGPHSYSTQTHREILRSTSRRKAHAPLAA